jgi:hypothetical protein
MRPILIALPILLAGSAFAQSNQTDDDEKPGSRAVDSKKNKANDNDDDDSDTPPVAGTSSKAPAAPAAQGGVDRSDDLPGEHSSPGTKDSDDDRGPEVTTTTKTRGHGRLRMNDRAAHQEGAYEGVSIGGEGLPPHPPKLPLAGLQRMTWPGFQVRDGVPTVFLQTTGAPNYAVTESPGVIVVTLRGTKILLRNNQRPLDVREFKTTVTEVAAKPHGHDVVVTIRHKGDATHHERVEQSAGGYQLLLIELPAK